MNKNKKIIMDKIENAREDLLTALNLLVEENKDGKQFDYVNSPRLSDSFDILKRTVTRIESIVYQEK